MSNDRRMSDARVAELRAVVHNAGDLDRWLAALLDEALAALEAAEARPCDDPARISVGGLTKIQRASLVRFSNVMADKLRANSHKGDSWVNDDAFDLLDRVVEEARELKAALVKLTECRTPETLAMVRESVRHEAADVANMAMMVADAAEADVPSIVGLEAKDRASEWASESIAADLTALRARAEAAEARAAEGERDRELLREYGAALAVDPDNLGVDVLTRIEARASALAKEGGHSYDPECVCLDCFAAKPAADVDAELRAAGADPEAIAAQGVAFVAALRAAPAAATQPQPGGEGDPLAEMRAYVAELNEAARAIVVAATRVRCKECSELCLLCTHMDPLPPSATPKPDPLREMRSFALSVDGIAISQCAHSQEHADGIAVGAATMLAIAERTVLPALAAAQRDAKVNLAEVKRLRTIVHADYQIKSEQEKRIYERQSASEAEVAKLRTRCRNQRRELRDQERRRERAVAAVLRAWRSADERATLCDERATAAEAEVVRLTEACAAANASNQRRLADMKEAAADRATMRALVEAMQAEHRRQPNGLTLKGLQALRAAEKVSPTTDPPNVVDARVNEKLGGSK